MTAAAEPRPTRGWWRLGLAVLGVVATVACSDDEPSQSTLGPLDVPGATDPSSAPTAAGVAPASTMEATAASGVAGATGSGFVSIDVRLGASGIEESLTLDRATVPADQLDPISVDAFCTALDDGDAWRVSVTDLRRLSAGSRLVSAVLRIDAMITAPGVYEGSLDVGDAEQNVTRYDGPITLDEGLTSGTFDLRDVNGAAATGRFVCAPEPVTTTTVPASPAAGSTPGGETGSTAPPLPTVPEATS